MSFKEKIEEFFDKYLFNSKWTCNNCGDEIFNGKYFCEDCEKNLPFNNGCICEHCGRKTVQNEKYCLDCKGKNLSVDKARSCFVYKEPISFLIQSFKYDQKKYIADIFVHYLFLSAVQNCFTPDYIVYVPMTNKALEERDYNHGEILAKKLAEKMGVTAIDCLVKVRETNRQAKLSASERLKNLQGCFRVVNPKMIKDKSLLIVDDVLTTGATSETVASVLKKAGAKTVMLLTVASVPFNNK